MLMNNFRDESVEENIAKINAQSWTLVEDGIRDHTWAKLKNSKVHVISSYYDEDGFFSREVYIGDSYKEAMASDSVLNHWETFEPNFDDDWDEDEDELVE